MQWLLHQEKPNQAGPNGQFFYTTHFLVAAVSFWLDSQCIQKDAIPFLITHI